MQAAINAAIQVFQSKITDDLTVTITFVNDPQTDLGASNTATYDYAYSAFLAKLKGRATSLNDAKAAKGLPDSANDPLLGGSLINLTSAHARLMGLSTDLPADGDATVSLKMAVHNFTRPGDPQKYDLQSTVEHEIDEVLGFASNLKNGQVISPVDLFRYDGSGQRSFTTNGDNAYFSVDGVSLLARFNQDPAGDYHDWWSPGDQRWSPPGSMPVAQVQDAFGLPGTFQELGTNELTVLDVIGYTLAGSTSIPSPAPPALSISVDSAGQITLSWPNDGRIFVLQESANLGSGTWADSATGPTNPAVILAAASQSFYRLYHPALPAVAAVPSAPVRMLTATAYRRQTHVFRLSRPPQPGVAESGE